MSRKYKFDSNIAMLVDASRKVERPAAAKAAPVLELKPGFHPNPLTTTARGQAGAVHPVELRLSKDRGKAKTSHKKGATKASKKG